jgi:hypothetical protein
MVDDGVDQAFDHIGVGAAAVLPFAVHLYEDDVVLAYYPVGAGRGAGVVGLEEIEPVPGHHLDQIVHTVL